MSSISSLIIFLIVLSGLVFVHELGHFVTAKWFGVHVEEFGIGFPPRLLGVVKDEGGRLRLVGRKSPKKTGGSAGGHTIYSLNAIPLGGFVRPVGEDDPLVPGGLASSPKRVRVVILAAGSTFNLLFAFLVFVAGFRLGWPDRVVVNRVAGDSPAQRVGLQAEDIILRADGADIHYPNQLTDITYRHLGRSMSLVIRRGEQVVPLTITPRPLAEVPEGQGPMGIEMRPDLVTDYSWPQAVLRAGQELAYQFQVLIQLPGRIIRQEVPLAAVRPIGPVGLNDLTREAVVTAQEINEWFPILQLIGLVSVALATTNLLPLPALDGGRILFVLIEAVRGRRVDPAREGMVHLIGMAMLLALMAFITYQDIFNPIIPR